VSDQEQMRKDFYDYALQLDSPQNSSTPPNTKMCSEDSLEDNQQHEIIKNVLFWIEGVFQIIVGVIGIVSNLVAIPILCSPSMKSIFNKLLICLLILHTIYICGVISKGMIWQRLDNDENRKSEVWSTIVFSYVYPLPELMLYSSTFITMLMARQRYLAIRHPIEYRNSNLTTNPWVPAIKSLILVLTAALLLTFPLFLETSLKSEVSSSFETNATHFQYVSSVI
jgi:hypothetical protein